jgi:hypothetical protein
VTGTRDHIRKCGTSVRAHPPLRVACAGRSPELERRSQPGIPGGVPNNHRYRQWDGNRPGRVPGERAGTRKVRGLAQLLPDELRKPDQRRAGQGGDPSRPGEHRSSTRSRAGRPDAPNASSAGRPGSGTAQGSVRGFETPAIRHDPAFVDRLSAWIATGRCTTVGIRGGT